MAHVAGSPGSGGGPQPATARRPIGGQGWVDEKRRSAFDARTIRAGAPVIVRAGRDLGLAQLPAGRAIEVQHHADLRKGDSLIVVTFACATDKTG
jgi:hypothetical protein